MKLLIVSATNDEVQPIINSLQLIKVISNHHKSYRFGDEDIDILITGAGPVFTTYHLFAALSGRSFDVVINAGICGSYSRQLCNGSIVNVTSEQFADLGIEQPSGYFTLFEKGLSNPDLFPFTGGKMLNRSMPAWLNDANLQKVRGITSGTAHGNAESIEIIRKKFNPDIETMEGAAFFYVCMQQSLTFAEIRAVSNYVEPRNEMNWNIPLAISNLNSKLIHIFEHLR
jgi:futalosine hydrolase